METSNGPSPPLSTPVARTPMPWIGQCLRSWVIGYLRGYPRPRHLRSHPCALPHGPAHPRADGDPDFYSESPTGEPDHCCPHPISNAPTNHGAVDTDPDPDGQTQPLYL